MMLPRADVEWLEADDSAADSLKHWPVVTAVPFLVPGLSWFTDDVAASSVSASCAAAAPGKRGNIEAHVQAASLFPKR